jgi:hypothetical protein
MAHSTEALMISPDDSVPFNAALERPFLRNTYLPVTMKLADIITQTLQFFRAPSSLQDDQLCRALTELPESTPIREVNGILINSGDLRKLILADVSQKANWADDTVS